MKRKGNFLGSFCFAASLGLLAPFAYAILSRQFMWAAGIAAYGLLLVGYLIPQCSPLGQESEEKDGQKKTPVSKGDDTKSEEDLLDKDEKNDEVYKKIKALEDGLSEVIKRIGQIEAAISKTESHRSEKYQTKTQPETHKKNSIHVDGPNAALSEKSQHPSNKPAETKAEDVHKFLVRVDSSSLRDGISIGGRIKVYRTAIGNCQLNNYEELILKDLELGQKFTDNMYSTLKSYNLLKLFELNSSDVIDHKIVKLEAAKIRVSEGINAHTDQFEVTLEKKGKIEVDNPKINDSIFNI